MKKTATIPNYPKHLRWCSECGQLEEDHHYGVGFCPTALAVGKEKAYKIRKTLRTKK